MEISIHAPREGSDPIGMDRQVGENVFQSTLPVRGATAVIQRDFNHNTDFNPRSP